MKIKTLIVVFLTIALLASVSEAGKDRRKKKQREDRQEEGSTETSSSGGMEDSGKAAKEDKERSSVLEKQSEKKGNQDDSSSSEEDENKEGASKNDTIIIRKRRESVWRRSVVANAPLVSSTDKVLTRTPDIEYVVLPTDSEETMARQEQELRERFGDSTPEPQRSLN